LTASPSVSYDPRNDKGIAFTREEGDKDDPRGNLPNAVKLMDTQILRIREQLGNPDLPIEKYVYLTNILDTNERLIFRTVISDLAKLLQLVCTQAGGGMSPADPHCATSGGPFIRQVQAPDRTSLHGDNGAGISASHQTGWISCMARFIETNSSRTRGLLGDPDPEGWPVRGLAPGTSDTTAGMEMTS